MASGTWGTGPADSHPLQVRISFMMDTVTAQTGFKLRDNSLGAADAQECAVDVADWVTTSFRTILATEDRLLGVDVLDLTTGLGGSVSFANTMGTANISADAQLPTFMQVPVSLKSELRRRYGQGRMLWPIRGELSVSKRLLNPAGAAVLQGVIDAMAARYLGTGSSSDYVLINAHGPIAEKPATSTSPIRPAVPAMWHDVQTIRLATKMSFLRSRQDD